MSTLCLLYVKAVDWVEAYHPKFYIAENSPKLLGYWHYGYACERLEQLGYKCATWTLDAADYGVPQHRVRTFLVAVRKDLTLPTRPKPTHGDVDQRRKNKRLKPYLTLDDQKHALMSFERRSCAKHQPPSCAAARTRINF